MRPAAASALSWRGTLDRARWWRLNAWFLPPLAAATCLDAALRGEGDALVFSVPLGLAPQPPARPALHALWALCLALAALRLPADVRRARHLGIAAPTFAAVVAFSVVGCALADYLTVQGAEVTPLHYALTTAALLSVLNAAWLYLKLACLPGRLTEA